MRNPAWPMRRCCLALASMALMLAVPEMPVLAGASPSRDWSKAPAIVEVDTTGDIYALGDVHGDYRRLADVLVAGGVIPGKPDKPEQVEWSAGKAVLVCTGDLIDKGDHTLKVISLFRALQARAAEAGGRVVVTMGNHEAEFLADPDHDKKAKVFLDELKAAKIDPDEVAEGTDEGGVGRFLTTLPIAARVNDWFFVHAGNTKGLTLKTLRTALQDGIDADGYGAKILSDGDSLLEARLHPAPWWEKKGNAPEQDRRRLADLVEALGVDHLVVGHQPGKVLFSDGTHRKKGEIAQEFDGLIFLIDVGMSEAINLSRGALLKIHDGGKAATAHFPDRDKERLWTKP